MGDTVFDIVPILDESGGEIGYMCKGKVSPEDFAERLLRDYDAEIELDRIYHELVRWVPVGKNNPDRQYWSRTLQPAKEKGHGVFESTQFYWY